MLCSNTVVDIVAKYANEEVFNLCTKLRALPKHLVNMSMQVRRKEERNEGRKKKKGLVGAHDLILPYMN
jgi:hypothetical protein